MEMRFNGKAPVVHPDATVLDGAKLIGDVTLAPHSSVWFNAVLRGDFGAIELGEYANVQDNCTLHVDPGGKCVIGRYASVGHGATVHGATVCDCALVGMNATILNGAVIGEGSIVGAGALVTERTVIPPHSLAVGVPAKVIKQLPDAVEKMQKDHSLVYAETAEAYKRDTAEKK